MAEAMLVGSILYYTSICPDRENGSYSDEVHDHAVIPTDDAILMFVSMRHILTVSGEVYLGPYSCRDCKLWAVKALSAISYRTNGSAQKVVFTID